MHSMRLAVSSVEFCFDTLLLLGGRAMAFHLDSRSRKYWGPLRKLQPHGTWEGLDEAGVLAAIPRRGGGGSGHQSGSRRRGRRQEGRGAVQALAMLFWNRQVGFPWSPE